MGGLGNTRTEACFACRTDILSHGLECDEDIWRKRSVRLNLKKKKQRSSCVNGLYESREKKGKGSTDVLTGSCYWKVEKQETNFTCELLIKFFVKPSLDIGRRLCRGRARTRGRGKFPATFSWAGR